MRRRPDAAQILAMLADPDKMAGALLPAVPKGTPVEAFMSDQERLRHNELTRAMAPLLRRRRTLLLSTGPRANNLRRKNGNHHLPGGAWRTLLTMAERREGAQMSCASRPATMITSTSRRPAPAVLAQTIRAHTLTCLIPTYPVSQMEFRHGTLPGLGQWDNAKRKASHAKRRKRLAHSASGTMGQWDTGPRIRSVRAYARARVPVFQCPIFLRGMDIQKLRWDKTWDTARTGRPTDKIVGVYCG